MSHTSRTRTRSTITNCLRFGVVFLILLVPTWTRIAAQSCTSCLSESNVRVQFATAMCAEGMTTVQIAGHTATTFGASCGQDEYEGSDWTDTFLNVDQEYTFSTGSNVCSTHIVFSVPAGYELEINGEKTNEINKGGPHKGDGTDVWTIVLRKCKGPSLGAGESSGTRLGSVEWAVGLGILSDGRSAEKISLYQESITAQTYTPASLIYSAPGKSNEVDVVRNPDQSLRQVRAPQTLADVVTINSSEYEVRFYRPEDVGSKVNGIYSLTGQPFTVWKIKNPDASPLGRLQISKTQNGVTETSEYKIDATNGSWTLTSNGGLRVETKLTISPTANSRIETTTVRDGITQQLSSKTEKFFFNFPWGEEVTRETIYPYDNSVTQLTGEGSAVDVAPLVTEYDYYTDPAQGGSYSKLLGVRRPDGSWEKYFYDNFGKVSLSLRPWKDQPYASADASNSHAINYYYTNTDGLRVSLFNLNLDHIDENINGIRVRRTTYDRISTTINGEPAVREVETIFSSNTVGVATATTKYHASASDFFAGRTALVEYPDGRRDTYAYEHGDYVDNADPSLRQFNPNPNGPAQRQTVIHGTASSPNGIAFKTTKETSIQNPKGQGVFSETYVYNGIDYERVSWSAMDYDSQSHLVQTRRNDGSVSTSTWNGDLLSSQTDETGIQTTFTYDALNRTKTRTKVGIAAGGGFASQMDIVTTYGYDGMGRTTSETNAAGSLTLVKTRDYDLAGRIKKENDEAGLSTLYDYSYGGRIQKVTSPGGAYRITENFLDGQTKTTSGTSVVIRTYDYGVNADGTRYSQEFIGDAGASSPRWTITTSDWADQIVKIETPGFVTGMNLIQNFSYNVKGQLEYKSQYAGATRVVADFRYEYDELGEEIREGIDVDGNGSLTSGSIDRVGERESLYEKNGSDWFRVITSRTYLVNNDSTPTSKSERLRLTFPAGPQFSQEVINVDEAGQSTVTTNSIDRAAKKRTQTVNTPDSATDSVAIFVNGLIQSETPSTPETATTYSYDALGRQTSATSPQSGTTSTGYESGTNRVLSQTRGTIVTTLSYYPATHRNAGRVRSRADSANKLTYFEYNLRGEMIRTWGDATYPMEYVYDSYGQKTELHTYRGGKGWQLASFPSSSAGAIDVTKWIYHEATGLLNKKEDALGKQTVYAYYPSKQLFKRVWARTNAGAGVECVYTYDPNTGEVTSVDYSDGTPDVTMGYDRGGRASSVTDAAGTHTIAYNAKNEFAGDQVTGGILDGINVSISYDGFLRRSSLNAMSGTTALVNQGYTYDTSSRLETVTSGTQTATYSYHPTSGLMNGTSYTGGTSVARSYDSLGRIQSVTNTPASGAPISYAYTYNNLNQRTRVTREDNSYWSYNYNDRGELTSGKKFWSDNSAVAGQQFEFGYDNIGNRGNAKNGGDATGSNLRQSSYTANALNQYSQRSVPGAIDVLGTSDAAATVTVNNQATYRRGPYFQTTLAFDNSVNAVSSQVNVIGVKQNAGPNGEDAVEQKSGNMFLPTALENYTYDLDGNLLTDGRWQYTWDAENRLTSMTALSGVPVSAKKKLEFAYNYQGRRIRKKVYSWNAGTSSYDLQSTTKFIYDGWNVIAELDGSGALVKNYAWGRDLSGTLQGAGGVGGLLMVGDATGTYQVGYDGNGNVATLVKSSDGKVAASYDYDPFGNTLQENGSSSSSSPFRFSTKYTDAETNLIYYGYRYYNPQIGRWISRDPIEETGGANLHGFVNNNPTNKIDQLGMYEVDTHYYLTYFLASNIGCFTDDEARQIANGDQFTDELASQSPGPGWNPSSWDPTPSGIGSYASGQYTLNDDQVRRNMRFHALHLGSEMGRGSARLWMDAAAGTTAGRLLRFGTYLHYLQDTFSHNMFTNPVHGHLYGTHLVDKTSENPTAAQMMVAATWKALIEIGNQTKRCGCEPKWKGDMWGKINSFINAPDAPSKRIAAMYAYQEDPRLDSYLENKRQILGVAPRFPWNR